MIRKRIFQKGIKMALFAVIVTALLGQIIMHLWNWLTPPLFGWPLISFWQALGLFLLSRIFFGGFRGRSYGSRRQWRRRFAERWEHMTPEQRDQFREGVRGSCGPFAPPAPDVKA